jgi:hypothetical protein
LIWSHYTADRRLANRAARAFNTLSAATIVFRTHT